MRQGLITEHNDLKTLGQAGSEGKDIVEIKLTSTDKL